MGDGEGDWGTIRTDWGTPKGCRHQSEMGRGGGQRGGEPRRRSILMGHRRRASGCYHGGEGWAECSREHGLDTVAGRGDGDRAKIYACDEDMGTEGTKQVINEKMSLIIRSMCCSVVV